MNTLFRVNGVQLDSNPSFEVEIYTHRKNIRICMVLRKIKHEMLEFYIKICKIKNFNI